MSSRQLISVSLEFLLSDAGTDSTEDAEEGPGRPEEGGREGPAGGRGEEAGGSEEEAGRGRRKEEEGE